MAEFFANIPKIPYEGPQSTNPLAFKYYNPDDKPDNRAKRSRLTFG